MRSFVAALMVLALTMASLPWQATLADHSGTNYVTAAVSDKAPEDNAAEGKFADCCDMPVSSMHHGNVHCSIDCPVLAFSAGIQPAAHAVRFPSAIHDHRIVETASTPFRPPIFS